VANAAIVGPIIIATAISAAAFAVSPEIQKIPIPQLAIPSARTARIIAMIDPVTLRASSLSVEDAFSAIYIPKSIHMRLAVEAFLPTASIRRKRRLDWARTCALSSILSV
jgi:hypothetical protein